MKKNTFLTKRKSFPKEKLCEFNFSKNRNNFILLVLINVFGITAQAQNIRYVKTGGTGNGSSWAAASNDIQAMINASSTGDEIKVAAGTYKPNRTAESPTVVYAGTDATTKRKRTFLLKNGVKLTGGYPANASTTTEVSKPIDNKTILSGDFNGDDTFTSGVVLGGNSENAYNVVMIAGNANEVYTLKGFHITGGNANSTSSITINASEAINLNTGAGINIVAKSVSNTNSYVNDYTEINIEACVLYRNTAKYGGAIRIRSKTESNITNSIFYENLATDYGGAVSHSSFRGDFEYNTFYSNRAVMEGGAIQAAKFDNDLTTDVRSGFHSNIFDQNIKATNTTNVIGSDISVGSGTQSNNRLSTNNVFGKNRIQYVATYLDFIGTGGGSSIGNSLYTTASVPFANTATKDFRLHYSTDFEGSFYGNTLNDTFDIAGKPRRIGPSSDIGAHEWQLTPDQNGVLYVKKGANGFGSSWNDATSELAVGIYYMNMCDKGRLNSSEPNPILHGVNEIWVSAGTYKPQFGNVIEDDRFGPDDLIYFDGYDPTSPRAEFFFPTNTKIFGGFPSTGNPVKADRNWKTNPTILSGDLNNNDTSTGFGSNLVLENRTDNSYNIFVMSGDAGVSVLDGLQFKGGNASINESMMLDNNLYDGTSSFYSGVGGAGKIKIESGSMDIVNCVFKENFAIGNSIDQKGGGALFIDTYQSSINIINTLFESNKSNQQGGALDLGDVYSDLKIINSTLTGNLSNTQGGAIALNTNTQTVYLQNSIVFGNVSTIANTQSFTTAVPTTTFIRQNNLIEGSSLTTNGNINATGVLLANLFKSVDRTNADYLQLTNNAVAKNAGNNSLYLATFPTSDLAKNTRILGNTIDLGAYENTCNLNLPSAQSQSFCSAATVANLVATGTNLKWYANATATQSLATTTALATGTYYVSQNEGTCESEKLAVNITILAQAAIPTANSPQELYENSTLSAITISPSNIIWYATENDALSQTNALNNNTLLVNGTTYYAVNAPGNNLCPSNPHPVSVVLTPVLGQENFDKNAFSYYPNPVINSLNISYKNMIHKVEVFDLQGRKIKSQNFESDAVQIDLSELPTATYLLKVYSINEIEVIKIIKK